MSKTLLKKIHIERFRALTNVDIEFGESVTVVCGKNGTSKSSILGIAAQIFSFDTDYVKNTPLSHRQVAGGSFKSQYKEHFRISDKFDPVGSMVVNIDLHDGYTNQSATAKLELTKRVNSSRPVVRNNSTVMKKEKSRNFTHPVIFLSLKRLYPIADRDYNVINFDYLNDHKQVFIGLTNELLNRQSSLATSTEGTISSAVAHGDDYDQDSVSAGEDNAGQIVLALMSFRKLKDEYEDYKGGLLLIDEADAGLFPTAQVNLLRILERECCRLNIQVIMTSHSPTIIEYAHQINQQYPKRFKTVYLSNTYGNVQVMQDWSWTNISADINTKTTSITNSEKLPKVPVYFEDKEAYDLYSQIVSRKNIKKFLDPFSELTLGCSNYIQLINKKVPEFAERSIICLDSDAKTLINGRNIKNLVLLPGNLPPDQLIFEHLYNLDPNDGYWQNPLQFTRHVFTNIAAEIIREFSISGSRVNVKQVVSSYQGNKTPRDLFKRFYKNSTFKDLVTGITKPYNPWKHWAGTNPEACTLFLQHLNDALQVVMSKGFAVDPGRLAALNTREKRA